MRLVVTESAMCVMKALIDEKSFCLLRRVRMSTYLKLWAFTTTDQSLATHTTYGTHTDKAAHLVGEKVEELLLLNHVDH